MDTNSLVGHGAGQVRAALGHDESVARSADDEPWDIAFFLGDWTEPPALRFLSEAPIKVRATAQAVLEAVAEAPPPKFAGALHWQAMNGDMGGIYEARIKGPDKRLYRLFCLLERSAPGLRNPTLVVLTGMSKPYRRVRRLRDEYLAASPRRVQF